MTALEKYPNKVYFNKKWKKVSPFAIICKDHLEEMMQSETPKDFGEKVVAKLKELNQEFEGDKTFGAVSDDYMKKFQIVVERYDNMISATKYLFDADASAQGMAVTEAKTKKVKI